MALFRQGLGSALVDNSSVEPFGRHFSGEGKYRRALEAKEHAGNVTVGALCQPPERSGGGFPGLAYFFRWAEKISAAPPGFSQPPRAANIPSIETPKSLHNM